MKRNIFLAQNLLKSLDDDDDKSVRRRRRVFCKEVNSCSLATSFGSCCMRYHGRMFGQHESLSQSSF